MLPRNADCQSANIIFFQDNRGVLDARRDESDFLYNLNIAQNPNDAMPLFFSRSKLLDSGVVRQQFHLLNGDLVQLAEPRLGRGIFS
jgi:hypothetical protein